MPDSAEKIRLRCVILHRLLVARGLSEKHVLLVMEHIIPILRSGDSIVERARQNEHAAARESIDIYDAAWKRIIRL